MIEPQDPLLQKILSPLDPALKSAKKLDEQQIELFYAAAYGFYHVGDYEKSEQFFTHLIFNDPYDKRFWKGIASARQMQKKYHEALNSWSVLCIFDEKNPTAHFHAAECLFSLNEKEEAMKALASCERFIEEENHPLKEKILHLRNTCLESSQ